MLSRLALATFDTPSGELCKRICRKGVMIISPEDAERTGLCKLFDEVAFFCKQNDEYGDFCALNTALSLLIRADRITLEQATPNYASYGKDVMRMMEYISDHLTDRLTYDTVAAQFYLSPKNLFRIFKKETGITMYQYVLERRIAKAREILGSGGSAAEAAHAAGFQDYTVFYRCFRKETGLTPTQYVNRLRAPLTPTA